MHLNIVVAAASFLIFIAAVLFAAKLGRIFLFILSTTFIIISNVTVQMGTEIFPGVIISWAIIIYSLVYLITDLVIEFYGRNVAYKLAANNLAVQIVFWVYIWISLKAVPYGDETSVKAFQTMSELFSANTQITIAAIVAAIGPFADIYTTHRIRNFLSRYKIGRSEIFNVLARAKVSTLLGEIINTALFFSIALFNSESSAAIILSVIITATLSKWCISAMDIPFLWMYFRYIGLPDDALAEDV